MNAQMQIIEDMNLIANNVRQIKENENKLADRTVPVDRDTLNRENAEMLEEVFGAGFRLLGRLVSDINRIANAAEMSR